MQDTLSRTLNTRRAPTRQRSTASKQVATQSASGPRPRCGPSRRLVRYTDRAGYLREVVLQRGAAGTTLVVDREALTHGDSRLLAHLAADEPFENAELLCRHYLKDARIRAPRCRAMAEEDLTVTPFAAEEEISSSLKARAERRVAARQSGQQLRGAASGGARVDPPIAMVSS